MTESIQPIILCGSLGTRLWPLSRSGFPKQPLDLPGAESLFRQAANRLVDVGLADIQVAKPIIVTGEEHRFLPAERLRESGIDLGAALLEPVGRNTAPALALAALAARADGLGRVMVVTPADQPLPISRPSPEQCKQLFAKPPEVLSSSLVSRQTQPKRAMTTLRQMRAAAKQPCSSSALWKSPARLLPISTKPKAAIT